jgi:M6 family metalloprotease-like protein
VATVEVIPAAPSLVAGRTAQLAATPKDAGGAALSGRAITWASGNAAVAAVNASGLVTGVAPGTASVTATVDGVSGAAAVTVTPVPVASVTITPATATLQVGAAAALAATARDSAGGALTGRTVTWSSATPAVATISTSGVVTGVAVGSATITATSEGRSGSAQVTVTPPPAFSVSIDAGSGALSLGLARRLTATVRASAGSTVANPVVTWRSSDTTVATVAASGLLVSRRQGTATIVATYTEGGSQFTGQAPVTVGAAPSVAECRLPNRTGSVGFGFPRSTARLRSVGTVRATVLFVDFSDGPATRTPQQMLDILTPNAERFYAGVSYGAMTLVLQPNLRWLRMSRPSTQYGWPSNVTFQSHLDLLQEAATLAASTTDFTQTDLLVVITNPDAPGITYGPALVPNPGQGIRVPGRTTTIDNATNSGRDLTGWGWGWLVHEMGHLLSLPDLYDLAPPAGRNAHLHVGQWSQMGLISGRGPEWTAFERWQLGWLGDAQVICAPSGTSIVELTPVETPGGNKTVLIPLSPTLAVGVESRRAIGFDAGLTQTGPLVYFVETTVGSGRGTMRVLPVDDSDPAKLTRILQLGQTITHQGASVTLLSRTDGTDVVQVIRP